MSELRGLQRSVGWIGQVIAWFVISVVVAMLAICVLIPRIGGATPYTILTGSMRPTLPPGTLVVSKPTSVDDINIGDVITFQIESGKPTVATHRVIGRIADREGNPEFLTKGDANNSPDAEPVSAVQIKGKTWYEVPHLGRVNILIDNAQRHLISVLIISGLLIYAGFMFTSSIRERITRSMEEEAVS